MAIAELYSLGSSISVSTNEISVVTGSSGAQAITTDGVYQLFVNASEMLKGDEFRIRLYEKAIAAGAATQVKFFEASLQGVQVELFVTPSFVLIHGWNMTIAKVAGADRAFTASIRQIS